MKMMNRRQMLGSLAVSASLPAKPLMAMQGVHLGTLARHQRSTADAVDEMITRGHRHSIGPIALCRLVARDRCDPHRARPLDR